MDKYTITAYNAGSDTATVTFVIAPREGFAGGTFTGVKLTGLPKDTIASVSAFMRSYVDSYIAGKKLEETKAATVSTEVATLLNKQTEF